MLARYQFIHATVVQINGIGVMIQGESGIGKSEVALQLIKKGALFVADDAVEITN
ncbi:MAG: HPr kinase/phosphorylase, partial [Clostridia bacterium]|nr:HPr kinase/phosphorylase [Clostridia bacterium]